ncbi:MAG: hypothetical protein AB8B65_11895 [Kordia sp.]|uniref:hypothetical protein n=1 Tax=Kordia sp. TaxID=1965332 RepID=UPI00385B75A0
MRTLKLKKIKISKVGNPYLVYGGAQNAAANNHKTEPNTIYCETQNEEDDTCASQTNSGRTGQTDGVRDRDNNRRQN